MKLQNKIAIITGAGRGLGRSNLRSGAERQAPPEPPPPLSRVCRTCYRAYGI